MSALAYLRDPPWLGRMESGFRRWETPADGTRYRWTGGHASFFVPATARAIVIPTRTTFNDPADPPVLVSIAIDDRAADEFVLGDDHWRAHELQLPPPGTPAAAPHRRPGRSRPARHAGRAGWRGDSRQVARLAAGGWRNNLMENSRMKAIEISTSGGPEVLRLVERPMPTPGPGEVLVRVEAAGVNRPDILQRLGQYPPPPGASDLPGLEIAGP